MKIFNWCLQYHNEDWIDFTLIRRRNEKVEIIVVGLRSVLYMYRFACEAGVESCAITSLGQKVFFSRYNAYELVCTIH